MAKITNLDKYLKYDKDVITYNGKDPMVCYIPDTFKSFGALTVTNIVETLGIMDVRIGNDSCTLKLLLLLKLQPSDISTETIKGQTYTVCTFEQGDTFIMHRTIVKQNAIISGLMNSILFLGKVPYFLKYNDIATIFDTSKDHADLDFNFSHIIFELLAAQLYRDPTDVTIPFRLSTAKEGKFVHLKNVIETPQSTTAKLLGSYFNEGITGAMTIDTRHNTKMEDILRY